MGWQFNPFTGQLDQTGSGGGGGGTSYDQSLNTTDSVQFQTVHVNTTSNTGNPLVWEIGDLGEFAVYTAGTKRGALSLDDALGKLNFYNSTSLSAFSLTDDGNVVIGYYYGPAVSVNNDGVTSFASGSAQIDSTGKVISHNAFLVSGDNGNHMEVNADPYCELKFSYAGANNGALSYDPGSQRLNFYNGNSFSSIFLADDGTTGFGPYFGSPVTVDSSSNLSAPGSASFASGSAQIDGYGNAIFTSIWNSGGGGLTTDGTNLYWNGTQIA